MQLVVSDLAAERGGRPVFEGLAFVLEGGTALSVEGPNGAGKSTLLRVLSGLLPATRGTARLDPPDAEDADMPLGERLHYIGHADGLKPALSPRDHLAFAARLLGRSRKPAASPDEALDRLGLAHAADLPCAYLSAGQRRRVALARLLVADRPLWLLDEPSTALDAASEDRLLGMMRDHLARGGLILAATHDPIALPNLRTLRLRA